MVTFPANLRSVSFRSLTAHPPPLLFRTIPQPYKRPEVLAEAPRRRVHLLRFLGASKPRPEGVSPAALLPRLVQDRSESGAFFRVRALSPVTFERTRGELTARGFVASPAKKHAKPEKWSAASAALSPRSEIAAAERSDLSDVP